MNSTRKLVFILVISSIILICYFFFAIMTKFLIKLFVTCFFIGNSSFCPGTLCSFASLFFLHFVNKYILCVIKNYSYCNHCIILVFWSIFLCVGTLVGILLSSYYSRLLKVKDPKEIVIDEFIGQIYSVFLVWILIFFLGDLTDYLCVNNFKALLLYSLSFIFFRFFDIKKPGIIGKIDKRNFSSSIMLDDIFAAIYSVVPVYFCILIHYYL